MKSVIMKSLVIDFTKFFNEIGKELCKNTWLLTPEQIKSIQSVLSVRYSNSWKHYFFYKTRYIYQLKREKCTISLFDTIGDLHEAFFPLLLVFSINKFNIVQSSVVIMVVEANVDGTNFRQLPLLAFVAGINIAIVAIHGFEKCLEAAKVYESVEKTLSNIFVQVGFRLKNVQFIPVNDKNGANVITQSDELKWFYEMQKNSKTLLEAIDNLNYLVNYPYNNKPWRAVVNYTLGQVSNAVSIVCTSLSGKVKVQQHVWIKLSSNKMIQAQVIGISKEIRKIVTPENATEKATKGTQPTQLLLSPCSASIQELTGAILSEEKLEQATDITVHIIVLAEDWELKQNDILWMYCGPTKGKVQVTQLLQLIDERTGKTITQNPESIRSRESGIISLKILDSGIVATCFVEFPQFESFLLSELGKDKFDIPAVGIVKNIQ